MALSRRDYRYSVTVDNLDTGREIWSQDAADLADARAIAVHALSVTDGCRFLMVSVKPHIALLGTSSTVAWDAEVRPGASVRAIKLAASRCTNPRAWKP